MSFTSVSETKKQRIVASVVMDDDWSPYCEWIAHLNEEIAEGRRVNAAQAHKLLDLELKTGALLSHQVKQIEQLVRLKIEFVKRSRDKK